MTNSQRLATVRARLIRWLADHRDHFDPRDHGIAESILIRDGFYCGRRFDAGAHQAVWFMEEDELKIYADTGDLLCVLSGTEISEPPSPSQQTPVSTQSPPDRDIIQLPGAADDDDLRRAA